MLSILKSIFGRVFLVTFCSSLVFALEIGSEMELTRLVNARYSAAFRKTDENIKAQLPKGARGEVKEVKTFSSGNSGVLLKIKEGPLANELVWVHFNPRSPSLKLYNKDGGQVSAPKSAADASTTREVRALLDPSSAQIAKEDQVRRATSETSVTDSIPGRIENASKGLSKLNSANSPCIDCQNETAGAATLLTGVKVTEQNGGNLDAKVKCRHRGSYGSHSGKFEVVIEKNRVLHLDAQIDNGRCRISTKDFRQIEMPGTNIVLENSAGCAVTITTQNNIKSGFRRHPALNFSVAHIVENGPCAKLCPKIKNADSFWQVQADPQTNQCE